MSIQFPTLSQLGWRPGFSQHLTLQDFEAGYPARVTGVHRDKLSVLSSRGAATLPLPPGAAPVIGDWLLVEMDAPRVLRLIERHSTLESVVPGAAHRTQPIAANLDSLFVVIPCNDGLDPCWLQRCLALAFAAGVEPVIVLTRADLCADVTTRVDAVQAAAPGVACLAVNATVASAVQPLLAWLDVGQTVAFVGPAGAGTSTLVRTLAEDAPHADDGRGMFPLPGGAWVIDAPGLRESWADMADTTVQAVLDGVPSD